MKCTNCNSHIILSNGDIIQYFDTLQGDVEIHVGVCPNCKIPLVRMVFGKYYHDMKRMGEILSDSLVFPLVPQKVALASNIPAKYKEDLEEAALIINLSPKASAALCRRCLQNFIRDEFNIKERTLFSEIEKIIAQDIFPEYINKCLHAIREIGNFAAHPLKDTSTGQLIDVEPGESEWILELLIAMFELHFVRNEYNRNRLDILNAKLIAAGKSPL